MKRTGGFTIAELLAVLAILAICILAVWPVFSGGDRSSALEAETAILKSLREARATAISQNRETRVTISVSDLKVNDVELASDLKLNVVFAGEAPRSDVAIIRFFPDGTSTGGEVRILSTSRPRAIAVNWLTGDARPVVVNE